MIFLIRKKIVPEKLLHFVHSEKFGGNALFIGSVRTRSEDPSCRLQKVRCLEYSAYGKMALKKMSQIKKAILKKWKNRGIGKVAMVHRLGKLNIGEISVAVAVSAVHRKEAIQACHYGINQIKKSVPIFKKEFFRDGKSYWVGC